MWRTSAWEFGYNLVFTRMPGESYRRAQKLHESRGGRPSASKHCHNGLHYYCIRKLLMPSTLYLHACQVRMYLWWSLMYLVFTRTIPGEDVPLMESMYLVFTRAIPGEDVPLVESMYLVFTRTIPGEDVPLVESMYLVFTRMPGHSYRRRHKVFVVVLVSRISRALINSLVSELYPKTIGSSRGTAMVFRWCSNGSKFVRDN